MKCNFCYQEKKGKFFLLDLALCCIDCYKRIFTEFKEVKGGGV